MNLYFSLPHEPPYTSSHTPWPGCMQHSSKMLVGACQNSVNKPESQGSPAPNSTTATSNVCCNHENYCSWRPHESTRFFIETLLTILFLFCDIISWFYIWILNDKCLKTILFQIFNFQRSLLSINLDCAFSQIWT